MKKIFNKIKKYYKMVYRKYIKKIIPESIVKIVELKIWERLGKPVPPPHFIKQSVIKKYQKQFNVDTFIETGTYKGDMVYAVKDRFKKIFSIELDIDLYKQASYRFRKQKHIKIIQGDSGKVLIDIIPKINDIAIFWLDGHYSGGITAKGKKNTPILDELSFILESKHDHILLIDDARLFKGENDYPTIDRLQDFILSKKPSSEIKIKNDIIRVIIK